MRGGDDGGPRSRLAQGLGARGRIRQDLGLRPGRRHRSALHSLHFGHHRHPQGRGARQWRASGRARMVDAQSLRHQAGRDLVVRLRHRLGGRPLLHRLCAAHPRRHLDHVRGKPVGTPDAGAFWRVIAQHKAVALFNAPTAFRAIKKEDPDAKLMAQYDLSKFRALFLAGERADPPTVDWAEKTLKKPVIDHWWQTETGWCICGNPLGLGALPVKHGSATVPMPGYAMEVVDEAAKPLPRGTVGSLVVKLPLPPAALPTLWQQDERCVESYFAEFPGYYKTADAGFIDDDGYVWVMGRTDDIINVAGHRLSTGGMEEVLAAHADVAECAVLGIKDELKGEVPCGFIVLKAGVARDPAE